MESLIEKNTNSVLFSIYCVLKGILRGTETLSCPENLYIVPNHSVAILFTSRKSLDFLFIVFGPRSCLYLCFGRYK